MMKLYHIALADGTTLEVPAESGKEALRIALYPDVEEMHSMPVTEETLLNCYKECYDTALGSVTYAIKHWVDQDGTWYTVETLDVDAETKLIDDCSYDDFVRKLSSLDGSTGYNSIKDAKDEIIWTLDQAEEIFENATRIQNFDEDAAYDEWRCNH